MSTWTYTTEETVTTTEVPAEATVNPEPAVQDPVAPVPVVEQVTEETVPTVPAEDYQRLAAEFQNFRTRTVREKEVEGNRALHKFLGGLLPVLDTLENARKAGDLEEGPFAVIANQLSGILANGGLVSINEANIPFDAEIHEAVIAQPVEGVEPENVAQVFRTGYTTNYGLLRAAQVLVAK